jgi:hypothetical protein
MALETLRPLRFYRERDASVAETGKFLALLLLIGLAAAALATRTAQAGDRILHGCGGTASPSFQRTLDSPVRLGVRRLSASAAGSCVSAGVELGTRRRG